MTYVSEWCRERIAPALSPAAAARMERLSPGVDTERFHPGCGGAEVRTLLGIPADSPVVVCTARMVRRKGQDTLVKAWPRVLRSHPDARLLLVGDGPHRKAVERLARRLRVTDSVLFTGSVPWQEVPAYVDAGDVFAMPCRTRLLGLEPEAFGIVFLEAQACGLPALIGDSGGAPEAGRAGARVVPGGSSREAAEALVELLSAPQTRERRAKVGCADDWASVAGRLRELLEA